MRILDEASAREALAGGSAVTIGVFDGVHTGHRAVLAELVRRADGLPTVVVTFRNHPAIIVAPDRVPPMLTTLDRRIELLAQAGIDFGFVLDFDEATAALSAEQFAADVLSGQLHARIVVIGTGFRFGNGARGSAETLRLQAATLGLEVVEVSLVGGESPIRSTSVRAALASGDVATAAAMLGRPHELSGEVVRGDGRGRTIGFPTANLAIDEGIVVPARGVYAVTAAVDGVPGPRVANIGIRPTFAGTAETVEVHLFDVERDLYGASITISFVARLRDEQRFGWVDALIAQIGRDVGAARRILLAQTS